MIRRALMLVAVGATASALAIVACSDANRPAPGGASSGIYGSTSGGSSGASSGSSGGGGEGGADGSTEGGPGGPCEGPKQLGEPVIETRLVGDPPPALGGVVPDGTYILSSRNSYGATPNTDEDGGGPPDSGSSSSVVKRATMVIQGATMKISSSKGPPGALPADTATILTFTIAGSTITATPFCPAGGALTIPYSAVGTGIALFVDPTHREVYVRQ